MVRRSALGEPLEDSHIRQVGHSTDLHMFDIIDKPAGRDVASAYIYNCMRCGTICKVQYLCLGPAESRKRLIAGSAGIRPNEAQKNDPEAVANARSMHATPRIIPREHAWRRPSSSRARPSAAPPTACQCPSFPGCSTTGCRVTSGPPTTRSGCPLLAPSPC